MLPFCNVVCAVASGASNCKRVAGFRVNFVRKQQNVLMLHDCGRVVLLPFRRRRGSAVLPQEGKIDKRTGDPDAGGKTSGQKAVGHIAHILCLPIVSIPCVPCISATSCPSMMLPRFTFCICRLRLGTIRPSYDLCNTTRCLCCSWIDPRLQLKLIL